MEEELDMINHSHAFNWFFHWFVLWIDHNLLLLQSFTILDPFVNSLLYIDQTSFSECDVFLCTDFEFRIIHNESLEILIRVEDIDIYRWECLVDDVFPSLSLRSWHFKRIVLKPSQCSKVLHVQSTTLSFRHFTMNYKKSWFWSLISYMT